MLLSHYFNPFKPGVLHIGHKFLLPTNERRLKTNCWLCLNEVIYQFFHYTSNSPHLRHKWVTDHTTMTPIVYNKNANGSWIMPDLDVHSVLNFSCIWCWNSHLMKRRFYMRIRFWGNTDLYCWTIKNTFRVRFPASKDRWACPYRKHGSPQITVRLVVAGNR